MGKVFKGNFSRRLDPIRQAKLQADFERFLDANPLWRRRLEEIFRQADEEEQAGPPRPELAPEPEE